MQYFFIVLNKTLNVVIWEYVVLHKNLFTFLRLYFFILLFSYIQQ